MQKPNVVIASDHAGYALKSSLLALVGRYAGTLTDLGTHSEASVDYPDYGHAIAHAIEEGKAEMGVAICGSGVGICIALNRHGTIRAALCADHEVAALARKHNDANVLCLGARRISAEEAQECVKTFFTTAFEGGRHARRLEKLDH